MSGCAKKRDLQRTNHGSFEIHHLEIPPVLSRTACRFELWRPEEKEYFQGNFHSNHRESRDALFRSVCRYAKEGDLSKTSAKFEEVVKVITQNLRQESEAFFPELDRLFNGVSLRIS